MAGSYQYDNEGTQFLTFVISVLCLVLVPLTWSTVSFRGRSRKAHQGAFDAPGQKIAQAAALGKRLRPRISGRTLFLTLGWAAVAFLAHKLSTITVSSTNKIYDPFSILGLSASSTEQQIRKHYRKLSLKFHPDKLVLGPNQTAAEVETHYIELTKAYKALTDETTRKNFELYGHPDGRQELSMGIALPTWVVESHNNVWVLGAYGLVFGLLLPMLVGRWWYGSRARTKDGVYNSTAQAYFQNLRDDTPASRLLSLLAISEEFSSPGLDLLAERARASGKPYSGQKALDALEHQVRENLKHFGPSAALPTSFRSESVRRALVLLNAHMLRIESDDPATEKAKFRAASTALSLIQSLLSISLGHNWYQQTENVLALQQCMVQAVPIQAPRAVASIMQLPHITLPVAEKLVRATSKTDWGVQGFVAMSDSERRQRLTEGKKGLSEEQYAETLAVAKAWPRIELVGAEFKVAGERLVTAGALVQFVIKVRLSFPGEDSSVLKYGVRGDARRAKDILTDGTATTQGSEDTPKPGENDEDLGPEDSGSVPLGSARAPYLIGERKPHWIVFVGDSKVDRVMVQPTRVTDVGPTTRTFTLSFPAPPSAGVYTFNLVVRSDSYISSDAEQALRLTVEDPSVLDTEEDFDDDISEADEDTLAGQLAMMRGEKVKRSPVHGDADSDENEGSNASSDDDEENTDTDSDSDSD